jgi:hypothetical protein
MIDALTQLRETEQIPWEWIEDETRSLSDNTGSATMREAALASLKHARLDVWEGNPPLIITESRSLAGVLQALIAEHAGRIASVNGPCAGFLHNKLAPAAIESHETEQQLRDAQYVLDVQMHDLRAEFIGRESKLRQEYLDRVAEITAP